MDRKKLYVLAFIGVTLISIVLLIMTYRKENIIKTVTRPEPQNDEEQLSLGIQGEKDETKINVIVTPRQYTQKEWDEVCLKVFSVLEKGYQANEQRLITHVEGFGGDIEWVSGIENQKAYAEATLICGKKRASKLFYANAKDNTIDMPFSEQAAELIEQQLAQNPEASQIELPAKIEGQTVTYHIEPQNVTMTIILLYIGVGMLPLAARERDKHNKKMNEQQQLLDYPNIVNQLALLINAGLTVRGALFRIEEQYKINIEKGQDARAGFEELGRVCSHLRQGISEHKAIESWGKCVQLIPYMRLSTMLCQNLSKGTKGLVDLLGLEAIDAFAQRKELVKKMGEEAGTKLLIPMIALFALVLAILIVPAMKEL